MPTSSHFAGAAVLLLACTSGTRAVPFSPGDVFVGGDNGKIVHVSGTTGSIVQVLDTTVNNEIGGICFDSAWNLYATLAESAVAAVFDASGSLVSTSFGAASIPSGIPGIKARGCAVSATDGIYVAYSGQIIGTGVVRRYDVAGTLQQTYNIDLGSSSAGPRSLDLRCDACTLYYTQDGPGDEVGRHDVCADDPLTGFVDNAVPQRYFDLRVLPNDELLVVDTAFTALSYSAIQHLLFDGSLANIHTFSSSSIGVVSNLFNVDLDYFNPGSFWTAYFPGEIKQVELSAPHSVLQTISVAPHVTEPRAVEVLNPHRCGCADPPADMAAWWPFDELSGTSASDVAGGHDGTHGAGPTPDAGLVAYSLRFDGDDDHVLVPDHPDLDFPGGQFTVDLWIRPDAAEQSGTILRKGALVGSSGIELTGPGYHVFYASAGNFWFHIQGTSAEFSTTLSPSPAYFAVPEVWTFVAITVDGPGNVIKLYINDVLANTIPIPVTLGDPSNSSPLLIGGADTAPTEPQNFDGRLDEIELYPRVLSASEIQAIHAAGAAGKCKFGVHPQWDRAFCLGDEHARTAVAVCNRGVGPAVYEMSLRPLPAGSSGFGGGCSEDGPADFAYPTGGGGGGGGSYGAFPKAIAVPPGRCASQVVRLGRPPGLDAVDEVACYEVTVRDVDTGHVERANGSVQARDGVCPGFVLPGQAALEDAAVAVLVPGAPRPVDLELTTTDGDWGGVVVPLAAEPLDGDMSGRAAPIRVNGGRPGAAWVGKAELGSLGRAVRVALEIEADAREPFGFHDLVVSADLNGDGELEEPLLSLGLRSPLLSETDLDGDGLPNECEVAWGLDPYVPQRYERDDLVRLFGEALTRHMEALAKLLDETAAPGAKHIAKVEKFLRLASDKLALDKLVNALIFSRKAIQEIAKAGAGDVHSYAAAVVASSGCFVGGMVRLTESGDGIDSKVRELLDAGRAAEAADDLNAAMKKYQAAMREYRNATLR